MKIVSKWFFLCALLSTTTPSFALVSEVVNYVRQYKFGVDYSNSIDYVTMSYEMYASGAVPASCQLVSGNSSRQRCSVGMVGGASNGWGIFLQRAFKKQGFWYFDYDVGFGARYLSGALPAKDQSLSGFRLKMQNFR